MKRVYMLVVLLSLSLALVACTTQQTANQNQDHNKVKHDNTLVYATTDYTRINPLIDEHGEIFNLIFSGLTAHDADNKVVPGLAESWTYNPDEHSYVFKLRPHLLWHDKQPVTAEDVKFTIDAIRDPQNNSERAADFEDVTSTEVIDDRTIKISLSAPNAAFLDYMTIPVLPLHLLKSEDLQNSPFFQHPVGCGPYKLESFEQGQAFVLVRNEDYYLGAPKIEKIIAKVVPDDKLQTLQLQSGELDLALLDPKNAKLFEGRNDFKIYLMTTADYRGILFNFKNEYWQTHKDIIPAICYGIDSDAVVKNVLLGKGEVAWSPLQRNKYAHKSEKSFSYDPQRATSILENLGYRKNSQGFYEKNGDELGFVINVRPEEQERIDIAQLVSQQLKTLGINCRVNIESKIDWDKQMAFLVGWGSPFDADDHTYKVFGSNQAANFSGYSNAKVDEYLKKARQTDDTKLRAQYYADFQDEIAQDPPYAFICYLDANYVVNSKIQGIDPKKVLGHHGVGIFWNVHEWKFAD